VACGFDVSAVHFDALHVPDWQSTPLAHAAPGFLPFGFAGVTTLAEFAGASVSVVTSSKVVQAASELATANAKNACCERGTLRNARIAQYSCRGALRVEVIREDEAETIRRLAASRGRFADDSPIRANSSANWTLRTWFNEVPWGTDVPLRARRNVRAAPRVALNVRRVASGLDGRLHRLALGT
jgi:hypothetical protein